METARPDGGHTRELDVDAAATAVAEATQERGVIVRDTSSFGLPECIRVSCGTREETKTAVEVLNEVAADPRPEASEP